MIIALSLFDTIQKETALSDEPCNKLKCIRRNNGRLGECYIFANENTDYGTFFKKVSMIYGSKFRMKRIPPLVILMIGLLSSLLARITGIPSRLSFTMARIANIGQYYSSNKAIKELGISQTPIEVAIRDCCKWFKSQGYIQEEYVER